MANLFVILVQIRYSRHRYSSRSLYCDDRLLYKVFGETTVAVVLLLLVTDMLFAIKKSKLML